MRPLFSRGNVERTRANQMRPSATASETIMTTIDRALVQAAAFLDDGLYELAIEQCSKCIIRHNGADAAALALRAIAHRASGNDDRAAGDFAAAMRLSPAGARDIKETLRWEVGDAVAFFNRACAYQNEGDHARAINNYSEAIKLDPGHMMALVNRGLAFQTRDKNNPHKRGYDERYGGVPDCDSAMRDYRAVLARGSDAAACRIATARLKQLNGAAQTGR